MTTGILKPTATSRSVFKGAWLLYQAPAFTLCLLSRLYCLCSLGREEPSGPHQTPGWGSLLWDWVFTSFHLGWNVLIQRKLLHNPRPGFRPFESRGEWSVFLWHSAHKWVRRKNNYESWSSFIMNLWRNCPVYPRNSKNCAQYSKYISITCIRAHAYWTTLQYIFLPRLWWNL